MESQLERLNRLSSDLIGRLNECGLEDIESYMDERGRIFSELMRRPVDPGEREQANRILQMDKIIIARMQRLKEEASLELDRLQQGRRTKQLYESAGNGYGSYNEESFFFDKRR